MQVYLSCSLRDTRMGSRNTESQRCWRCVHRLSERRIFFYSLNPKIFLESFHVGAAFWTYDFAELLNGFIDFNTSF